MARFKCSAPQQSRARLQWLESILFVMHRGKDNLSVFPPQDEFILKTNVDSSQQKEQEPITLPFPSRDKDLVARALGQSTEHLAQSDTKLWVVVK